MLQMLLTVQTEPAVCSLYTVAVNLELIPRLPDIKQKVARHENPWVIYCAGI